MSSTETSKFKYYHYDPILALPIVAVVLFAIVTAIHGWLMARTRAWFLIPLIVGGLCTVPLHTTTSQFDTYTNSLLLQLRLVDLPPEQFPLRKPPIGNCFLISCRYDLHYTLHRFFIPPEHTRN